MGVCGGGGEEDGKARRVLERMGGFMGDGEWWGGVAIRACLGEEGGVRCLCFPHLDVTPTKIMG